MKGAAVLGCGTVGSGAVRMLTENSGQIERAAGQKIVLKYVVDIRPMELPQGVVMTSDFQTVLNDPEVSIVIETIGGAKIAYEYTKAALRSGRNVITSNKELVATKGDELLEIARENGCRYLYEASVGGGVPVVRPINICLAGNRLERVYGIVNGSTNYLLTSMEDRALSFPEALSEAKALGYVEANPAADIEGWDARRKIAILAHEAFGSRLADESMVPTAGISGIVPDDLKLAKELGYAVKLIACAHRCDGGYSAWVSPALVKDGHPLYMVRDVFNGIVASGDCVGDVMFYGRGAGSLPTASAIIGDVIEIGRSVPAVERFESAVAFVADDPEECRWMIRLEEKRPAPEECEIVTAGNAAAVLTKPMTRAQMLGFVGSTLEAGRFGCPIRMIEA